MTQVIFCDILHEMFHEIVPEKLFHQDFAGSCARHCFGRICLEAYQGKYFTIKILVMFMLNILPGRRNYVKLEVNSERLYLFKDR